MGANTDLQFRWADPDDAEAIAHAHRDSIQSLGPARYPRTWLTTGRKAHGRCVPQRDAKGRSLHHRHRRRRRQHARPWLSSDYVIEGSTHGTSVYVRGLAARRGIGSRLLAMAKDHARSGGATRVTVEASLTGVEFYKAKGFQETGRGETHLMSGRPISACS